MKLKHRLSVLDRIYSLYDEFIAPYDLACQHRCAACCTCNMTLTTLEGYHIIAGMDGAERKVLFEKARKVSNSERFQPQMTINKIAQLCKEGKPVPDEIIDPSWGACPLLTDNACPIYLLRPFGCRCMVSSLDCRETGKAQVDEIILTVNNLFLQYIEHIDPSGGTGSLIDILLYFDHPALLETFQKKMTIAENGSLAHNCPIPVLMVPPEHRHRVQPILQEIQLIG
ncbi:MAG: hypothetical protein ABFS43_11380 [Thermodesulfobacteriota bacterium]